MGIVEGHISDKFGNARRKPCYVDILTLLMCGGVRLFYHGMSTLDQRESLAREYYLKVLVDQRPFSEVAQRLHRIYPNHGTAIVGYIPGQNGVKGFQPSLVYPPIRMRGSNDLASVAIFSPERRPPVEFSCGRHLIRIDSQNRNDRRDEASMRFERYQQMVESFEGSRLVDRQRKAGLVSLFGVG